MKRRPLEESFEKLLGFYKAIPNEGPKKTNEYWASARAPLNCWEGGEKASVDEKISGPVGNFSFEKF